MFFLTNLCIRSNLDSERHKLLKPNYRKIFGDKDRFLNGYNLSLKNSLIPTVLGITCTLPCTLAACTLIRFNVTSSTKYFFSALRFRLFCYTPNKVTKLVR